MDPLDRMFSDTLQHLAQIVLGIEDIELRGLCQRVDRRGAFAAGIGRGLIMPWFRLQNSPSGIRSIRRSDRLSSYLVNMNTMALGMSLCAGPAAPRICVPPG
jgi:hypothetical protein